MKPMIFLVAALAASSQAAVTCTKDDVPEWNGKLPGVDAPRQAFLWAYLALPEGTPYGGGPGEDSWKGYMDGAQRCATLKEYEVRLAKHEETKTGHLAFLKGQGRPAGKPADYDLKAAVREMFLLRKWLANFKDVPQAEAWRKEVDEALKGFKTDLTAAKDAKKKLAAPVRLGKSAVEGAGKVEVNAAGAFDGSAARAPGAHEPARVDPNGVGPSGPAVSELPEAVPASAPTAPAGSETSAGGNLPEAMTAAGATTAGLGLVVGLGAGPVGVIAAASGLAVLAGLGLAGVGLGLRVVKTQTAPREEGEATAPPDDNKPEVVQGVGLAAATLSAIVGSGAASVGVIGAVTGVGVLGGAALLGAGWAWRLYRTNVVKK